MQSKERDGRGRRERRKGQDRWGRREKGMDREVGEEVLEEL